MDADGTITLQNFITNMGGWTTCMINVENNYWIPSEGYKYITNGEVYSEGIYLGINDSPENWHDTNDEPPILDEFDDESELSYEEEIINILMGDEL